MHPNVASIRTLTDSQVEAKLAKLSSIYFMTENPSVREQVILLLDTYKVELEERRDAARKKQQEQGDNGLDNLINIS
jgi:hypothetical protein